MSEIVRFGVSLEKGLLGQFDSLMRRKGYGSRSKALADIVREKLVQRDWAAGREVVGTISMIYNHRQRELAARLTGIQHRCHQVILAVQHIHLDHENCLEVVIVRGMPARIRALADAMRACRGVKHLALTMSSTGRTLS